MSKPLTTRDDILDPVDALGNLIQWAIGNRGPKAGNPYGIPEIEAALKTLGKAQGWTYGRIMESYYDAADNYRLDPKRENWTK